MKNSKKLLLAAGITAATFVMTGSASAHSNSYGDWSNDNKSWSREANDDSYGHWQKWDHDAHNAKAATYDNENESDNCDSKSGETVVSTLAADGRFNTLVAAVKAAGLVDALNSSSDKTVFAPTDEAFAALPAGTVEALLADPAKLASILTYHVVDGAVDAETALDLGEATTLNGQTITIEAREDGAYVNNAKLLETDIETDNGIIHVIDSVLLPQ